MRFLDSLRNFVSGLGTDKDKTSHNQFHVRPLERFEIDALYLEDGFARKIVDKVPADETREWRGWEARQAEAIYAAERQLKLRSKVRQARTWARLYGGAAILIGDGASDPSQPLDLNALGRGGIRYLHVFSRWELNPDEFERDLMSPNFGRPASYRIGGVGATDAPVVHASRFALFDGIDAPWLIREANQGWGLPLFQALRTALMNVASSAANSAALVEEAKLDIIKIPDLTSQLSDEEGLRRLLARFTYANQAKSTINALLLGADETHERKQMSFSGLSDLTMRQIEILAGVADIPATVLLGTAPKGLNATGDHDEKNYFNTVRSRQTNGLTDELAPLDEALLRHALGTRPRNATYTWAPLWQPTEEERATTAKAKAETTQIYASLGVFPRAGFALALRGQIVEDGVYPAFDVHVDEAALEKLGAEPLMVGKAAAAAAQAAADDDGAEPAAMGDALPAHLADGVPRPLYVSRPVVNAKAILAWAARQGIPNLVAPEDLHVTVVWSRDALDWFAAYQGAEQVRVGAGGPRDLERFGEDGRHLVLMFRSDEILWRHRDLRDLGASHDWPDFQPHITLSSDASGFDARGIVPFEGPIVLGPERFRAPKADPAPAA